MGLRASRQTISVYTLEQPLFSSPLGGGHVHDAGFQGDVKDM